MVHGMEIPATKKSSKIYILMNAVAIVVTGHIEILKKNLV